MPRRRVIAERVFAEPYGASEHSVLGWRSGSCVSAMGAIPASCGATASTPRATRPKRLESSTLGGPVFPTTAT